MHFFFSAFSQHSGQDVTIYASESAEKEVGFVRRLSNEVRLLFSYQKHVFFECY